MKTYEDGLNEAWECAKKLRHMDYSTLYEVFKGDDVVIHNIQVKGLEAVFEKYSASEAIDRIEKYEGFNVGDEVEHIRTSDRGIVVHIYSYSNQIDIMWKDGSTGIRLSIAKYKKTGRHFPQIEEVLKQMQEGEEN